MSTLVTLRDNVRRNLGETTPNTYTNADLNIFISEGYKYFSSILQEVGDGYFETTVNLGFTANVETITIANLASAFKKQSRLQRNLSNGSTIPLQYNEQRFIPNISLFSGTGDAYLPRWYFRGTDIVLWPYPSVTEAASSTSGLKFDYVYIPTFPSSGSADGFSFDANFPIQYEPAVELYATIAALEAKDAMGGISDIQSFRNRLEQWKENIIDSVSRTLTPDRVQYIGVDYSSMNWRY